MSEPFTDHRRAALAVLEAFLAGRIDLNNRAAQFLGSCVAFDGLTPKMADWLDKLLDRAGLPPMVWS